MLLTETTHDLFGDGRLWKENHEQEENLSIESCNFERRMNWFGRNRVLGRHDVGTTASDPRDGVRYNFWSNDSKFRSNS